MTNKERAEALHKEIGRQLFSAAPADRNVHEVAIECMTAALDALERETVERCVDWFVEQLAWGGDGYAWQPHRIDYREDPRNAAVRALIQDRTSTGQDLAGGQEGDSQEVAK